VKADFKEFKCTFIDFSYNANNTEYCQSNNKNESESGGLPNQSYGSKFGPNIPGSKKAQTHLSTQNVDLYKSGRQQIAPDK